MPLHAPVYPGRILAGSLAELELSITEAAHVLGVARPTVSRLVNSRASISSEMAIRLAKAFGSTAEFWLKLQLNYDPAQARKKADQIHVEPYHKLA